MFTKILNEEKLNEIIKTIKKEDVKREDRDSAIAELKAIISGIIMKNNEFSLELARDKTILNIRKIKKLREKAQEGNIQLSNFSSWLLGDFRSEREFFECHETIISLLNNFEEYIIRLKERETALLDVFASWGSLLIAIVAIIISLIAISMR